MPGTLQALGIPLRRGREFNAGDTADAPKVAMINETLARREFGNQDPIGRTIIAGYDLDEDCDVDPETLSTTELIELIVGVVRGRRAA